MTLDRLVRAGIVVIVALAAGASPADSATSFDFLFSMDSVRNDTQYFLNLAVSNYGYQRAGLEPLLPRIRNVDDDLPVLFFLQHASGWPLSQLVDLRARGASWSVIFTRVDVPQDALFAGIPDDPGPPYGNAWGYWKKNPRGARLRDQDVCGLVQIQLASQWVGASAALVVQGYPRGVTAPVFVADKKGRPYHAKKTGPPPGHGPKKGQGKPKSH